MDKPASIFVFCDRMPYCLYRGVPEGWRFVNRRVIDTPACYRYEEQFCGDISTRKVMTDYIENRFNSLVRKGYILHYKIRITQGG